MEASNQTRIVKSLEKLYGKEKAQERINGRNGDVYTVIREVMQLDEDDLPALKYVKEDLNCELKRHELLDWMTKWKLKFLQDVSLLEIQIATRVNPFYFYFAFDAPKEACVELREKYGISLSLDAELYLIAHDTIKKRNGKVETLKQAFLSEGRTGLDLDQLTKLEPFGAHALDHHELQQVELNDCSYGSLMKYFPNQRWKIMTKIRERRCLENQLERNEVDGSFGFKNRKKRLAQTLVEMMDIKKLKE